MYVIETKKGEWFCSESRKEIEKIIGVAGLPESLEKCKNLWYQPYNYLSGVMSDFFWAIKDGQTLDEAIPMRKWKEDLPLTKCKEGKVQFLGKKLPKWYREITSEESHSEQLVCRICGTSEEMSKDYNLCYVCWKEYHPDAN